MTVSLHPPQWKVFRSPERFRVLVAGRRFGKTYLAMTELCRVSSTSFGGSRGGRSERLSHGTQHPFNENVFLSTCPIPATAKSNPQRQTRERADSRDSTIVQVRRGLEEDPSWSILIPDIDTPPELIFGRGARDCQNPPDVAPNR